MVQSFLHKWTVLAHSPFCFWFCWSVLYQSSINSFDIWHTTALLLQHQTFCCQSFKSHLQNNTGFVCVKGIIVLESSAICNIQSFVNSSLAPFHQTKIPVSHWHHLMMSRVQASKNFKIVLPFLLYSWSSFSRMEVRRIFFFGRYQFTWPLV